MGVIDWLERFKSQPPQVRAIVLPPDGVEPRGFHGKNAFAEQVNLIGQDAKVIFDVGANRGQTAERYLVLFPDAAIYCFEPFPDSYKHIVEQFSADRRVRPYPLAVSEVIGVCSFHTFTNSVTNSLLPAVSDVYRFVEAGQMENTGVLTVESITVDEFCRRESIGHVDILKLDIQGGEVKAFRGAERMLSERRVGLVYTEVLFVPVYQEQGNFYDVAAYLGIHGYRLFDFYNFAYAENGQLKWGDAIFLPSEK
jgi:FkbM family methyltransferase